MIINSKETTVAYRCPGCGSSIVSIVGVFALSGDMMKLKCDCGMSEMTIVRTRDRKVRLSVPCLLCPKPHIYTINDSLFFGRDVFTLSCTYSGVDIAFVGTREKVLEELESSGRRLVELLGEAGLDDFNQLRGESGESADDDEVISDPQIEDIVRFVLYELSSDNKIHCACGGEGGPYSFEFTRDGVRVYCDACGASLEIPMKGVLSANAFLHCDELILKL